MTTLVGCGSLGGDATNRPLASGAVATEPPASAVPDADGVMTGDLTGLVDVIPVYDPEAPAPSMGGAALRALAALDPGVAVLEGDVEAAERAALTTALADLEAQPTGDVGAGGLRAARPSGSLVPGTSGGVILARAQLPTDVAGPAGSEGTAAEADTSVHDASLIGALVSGFDDLLNRNMPAGAGASSSGADTIGGAKVTMSLDIGRSTDGSTRFGMGIQADVTKNGLNAKLGMKASSDGLRCPDANGQVKFTVKVSLAAESGQTALARDLAATVIATVNDDATTGDTQIDIVQGTRRVKNGRQVYVESGATVRFVGDDLRGMKDSNLHLVRRSQQATIADVRDLSDIGHQAALGMGISALSMALNNWQNGGCVKIVAASPGTVAPGSTTQIPVKVLSRFDGADVPSKLDAALTGGASVNPTSLARTPGTLSYKAPDERNKTATIALTATSRRGIAKLALTANTGGGAAYHVAGGLQDFQVDQDVCDVMAPFSLDGTIGIAKFSGGLTGTYVVTGIFDIHYEGTYVITLPNGPGQPGSMVATSSGTISGVAGSGSETYTLTPLQACG